MNYLVQGEKFERISLVYYTASRYLTMSQTFPHTLPFAQLSSSILSINNKSFFIHKSLYFLIFGMEIILILWCISNCNFTHLILCQKIHLPTFATQQPAEGIRAGLAQSCHPPCHGRGPWLSQGCGSCAGLSLLNNIISVINKAESIFSLQSKFSLIETGSCYFCSYL